MLRIILKDSHLNFVYIDLVGNSLIILGEVSSKYHYITKEAKEALKTELTPSERH